MTVPFDDLCACAAQLGRSAATGADDPLVLRRLAALWDELGPSRAPAAVDVDADACVVLADIRTVAGQPELVASYATQIPDDGSVTLVLYGADPGDPDEWLPPLEAAVEAAGIGRRSGHDVLVVAEALSADDERLLAASAAGSIGPSPLPNVPGFSADELPALRRLAAWRLGHRRGTLALAGPPREHPLPPARMTAGRGTYWTEGAKFLAYYPDDRIELGAFTSIAADVTIQAGGGRGHAASAVTTFPLAFHLLSEAERERRGIAVEGTESAPETTRVGSDVWIGTGATINGGIQIGDGAIVAAGAVVFADVAPYAVVAGNPARVLRYRFSPPVIEALLRIRWWDWPDQVIADRADWFRRPVADFIERFDAAEEEAHER